MEIRSFSADDADMIASVVDLTNAATEVDAPFRHPETVRSYTGALRYGWDLETPETHAAWDDDGSLVGVLTLETSEWDNTHLVWAGITVHPDKRRRGHGTALLEFALGRAKEVSRRSIGIDGWDTPVARGFAAKHGLLRKSSAINRRQRLAAIDPSVLATMYDEATAAASGYELLRLVGRTPDDLLEAVAEVSASINDAPTDDLDIEDEMFSPERIANYETAQLEGGKRLYRVVARHTESGDLAGHSVVVVEDERPAFGEQHDTSVHRSHRGEGLASLLLEEAVKYAVSKGARAIEGYPVDHAHRDRWDTSGAYVGTVEMFRRCGFDEVGRRKPARPLMRRSRS